MAKRMAAVQLTADNYENEEEEEDRGQFEVASEEQLRERIIKKAKRGRAMQSETTGGLFSGIKLIAPSGNGTVSTTSISLPTASLPSISLSASSFPSTSPLSLPTSSEPVTSEYLIQLRSLNLSVSEWIENHVKKNPFVDLTPIFHDYEAHLSDIDSKFGLDSVGPASEQSSQATTDGEMVATETVTTDARTSSDSSDQEGGADDTITPQTSQADSEADDDSVFSVRSKLFYKKGGEYTELGIGQLKVQKTSAPGARLLLRNDTKLGNILLNIRVTPDIPVSTRGNNMFIVCMPNPPLSGKDDPSPVTYLLRVKTAQIADELFKNIKDAQ